MTTRKGIILAGGSGTRLYPATLGISKQLLQIYDKPMIYYPLSVLMLAGIREIAVITTPEDAAQFQRMLGDGTQWGLSLTFIKQENPEGLAQAYILAEEFLDGGPSALILGDNFFFGQGFTDILARADAKTTGGTIFGYRVADARRYGVAGFDENGKMETITEKPEVPASDYAITGLYFMDSTASDKARKVKPSARGELEITTLLEMYLEEDQLEIEQMGRGFAWFDMGTHESLLDAGNYVRTIETRQGLQLGSPEEIAFGRGWISREELRQRLQLYLKNDYGRNLERLLR